MKPTLFLTLLLAWCCNAFAAGAALLMDRDYIAPAQAATALNADESKQLSVLRAAPGVKSAAVVTANIAALNSSAITVAIEGTTYTIVGSRTQRGDGFLWSGKGDGGSTALFVSPDGKNVTGSVRFKGRNFRLTTMGRYFSLREVEHRETTESPPPKGAPAPGPIDPPAPPASSGAQGTKMHAMAAGDPTLKVLTVYSYEAVGIVFISNLDSEAQFQIAELNQSFANSNVHLNAVSVGTMALAQDAGFQGTVWFALQNTVLNPQILKKRDDTNADIVIVVIHNGTSPDGATWQINSSADNAFASIQAIGLGGYTYLHEIGHVIGARHAAFGTSTNDGNSSPYNYGHGWWQRFTGSPGVPPNCFHTIMSGPSLVNGVSCVVPGYPEDPQIPYWSNPAIYWSGLTNATVAATGSALANNALVLNNNGPSKTLLHNTKLYPQATVGRFLPTWTPLFY